MCTRVHVYVCICAVVDELGVRLHAISACLRCSYRRLLFDPEQPQFKAVSVAVPPVTTSCWAAAVPLALRGFTLTNLEPGATYTSFVVHAVSSAGHGMKSHEIGPITTTGAIFSI